LRTAVALFHDAVRLSFSGSRVELERTTRLQMDAVLLLLVLLARGLILLQAAVDVTVGRGAYSRPSMATAAALACVLESSLLAVVLVRRRRLTMAPLAADAAFGLLGLGLLSIATAHTEGRTGTIDWMLPYTVVTVGGLGLLVARERVGSLRDRAGYDWRGAIAVAALCVGYAASVSLPDLTAAETPSSVLTNVCNYPIFYLAAAGLSIGLSRRLQVIAQRNEDAARQAAELAEQAKWRTVAVDVFGPVLDLLDRAAEMDEAVPPALRQEAARLIGLIDATNPGIEVGGLE
jgi:hypothetical protein